MKGYEALGHRGVIVDGNGATVGYYRTVGYDKLLMCIKGERSLMSHAKMVENLGNMGLQTMMYE